MNLGTLLKSLGTVCDNPETEITSVTDNAENVRKGSLFVAVKGQNCDGNKKIPLALSLGAASVITDSDCTGENIIKVSDARKAYAFLCSAFYDNPQDKLKIIGITGTNGKTATAVYLRHILESAGVRCAIIGTLGSISDGHFRETGYTTPEPSVLFEELSFFAEQGIECVIIEVSSQSLCQHRVDPIEFTMGIFTNIGRDHLDYHKTPASYLEAKLRLASLSRKILVNKDSILAGAFNEDRCIFFSAKDFYSDISAKNIRFYEDYLSYLIFDGRTLTRVRVNGTGNIILYNSLCAAAAALTYGISPGIISFALSCLPQVEGRMQRVYDGDFSVYVDFAHTPDALFAVLAELKRRCRNKLICVFGCGGNRDKGKRSEMGHAASTFSDIIVITDDNPRNESSENIAEDIIKGINNKNNIYREPDREKAIAYALGKAQTGDIVVIAGKGHEKYQITCEGKKYFSDEIAVKKLLGV